MDSNPIDSDERQIADAFGQDVDPLEKYDSQFRDIDVDPFEMWLNNRVESKDLANGTVKNYERGVAQWESYMEDQDRHPACPSEIHVKGFARWCKDNGCQGKTVSKKLMAIGMAYRYFQAKKAFPHPMDFDPFAAARQELDLTNDGAKEPPNISRSALREKFSEISNIRDRAVTATQLKLGLRSSELCNIKLSEIHIDKPDVLKHYDEMGSHPALDDVKNAVYIPFDREKNKSSRPRVLPLDDEMQHILLQYLLVRQDNGEPWLLLSMRGNQLDRDAVLYLWKKHWHPEYEESARYKAITPHFGRHWFTTWFKREKGWGQELVEYMRGDKHGSGAVESRNDVIYEYVHTYYDDVVRKYTRDVFKLGVM